MTLLNFSFASEKSIEYNDEVLLGAPFHLTGFSYTFSIIPQTKYWRFGIRLSRKEFIKFFHPGGRYNEPEFSRDYIDIHLGVGHWDGINWSQPNLLHVKSYNVPDELSDAIPSNEYRELLPLKWKIEFKGGQLKTDIFDSGLFSITKNYVIDDEFKYFKIFAWADGVPFEIGGSIEISDSGEHRNDQNRIEAFKVGKILFRSGDMFDRDALDNIDLILLPASSEGSASSNILNRASELGIPYPQPNIAGSIVFYQVHYEHGLEAGYAFSVDKNESSLEIIDKIASQLAENNFREKKRTVNIPLFGIGSGVLLPEMTADIYDKRFNENPNAPNVVVSILDEKHFWSLLNHFSGRITEAINAENTEKPLAVIELSKSLNVEIGKVLYRINEQGEIIFLNLSNMDFDAANLLVHRNLETLAINSSEVHGIDNLIKVKTLKRLYMSRARSGNLQFLYEIKNLEVLDLSFNSLDDIDCVRNLKKLKSLNLKGNLVRDLSPLGLLKSLESLDLSANQVTSVQKIEALKKLKNLNISSNRIISITELHSLTKLEILDISSNAIIDVEIVLRFPLLRHLKADKNPFVRILQLALPENDNHLTAIKSLLLRQKEQGSRQVVLPAKVLLLGNHLSGKSSLLEFLHKNHLKTKVKGTHVLRIEKYPRNTTLLPEAVFFDFGGQDYYHGLYRSFFSSGSVYVLLWNEKYNKNEQKTDANDIQTQNFTLQYWLSQKNYIEVEKFGGQVDPLILVQSHADEDKRRSFSDALVTSEIRNEFFVSLKQTDKDVEKNEKGTASRTALQYLKVFIEELIKERQIFRFEPEWYINFLSFILNYGNKRHTSLDLESEILPHYNREEENKLELLKNDLDQLHHQGLILYYKDELPDRAWLNPSAFANYIHQRVFSIEFLKNGKVPYDDFDGIDNELLYLLRLQKVIFLHEFGEDGPEYIIPNFLPLASEDNSEFDLFTFGLESPSFILKFKNFLPFGLINQIICFFGTQRDKKVFWRDQVLFTLEGKAKVLIQVDFSVLDIRVYISYNLQLPELERQYIRKYIFYGILGLYWGIDDELLFNFKDFVSFLRGEVIKEQLSEEHPQFLKISEYENLFQNLACRPVDMYISLDDTHYISYCDLCNHDDSTAIISQKISKDGKLLGPSVNISVFQFQDFTNHILKRRKKVAISYSKKDLDYVLKFKDYLVPLSDDELIEDPWFCTELIAGVPWNEEIKKRFDEADIIFFMVSENLMSTRYVIENEIRNAIDKYNFDKSLMIIPILLVRYHFARKGKYDLSKFSALPYTLEPVNDFDDEHWAWHSISEAVRIMIEHTIDPGANDGKLTSELKEMYVRLIDKKYGKLR